MSTTYRYKIARLRGILLSVRGALKEAITLNSSSPLAHQVGLEGEELIEEVDLILVETADRSDDPEIQKPLPWRPGCVEQRGEYVKLYVGQVWELAEETMAETPDGHFDRTVSYEMVKLRVVSHSPEGEVHLRPLSEAEVTIVLSWYPKTTFVKGEAVSTPFKVVYEKAKVKDSKEELLPGDLLCHEAWGSSWEKMVPAKWADPAG